MALPSPVVEPPPTATAQSASSRRASSRASRATSIGTCITARANTPALLAPSMPATRSAVAACSGVVSTSARRAPRRSTSSGSRLSAPWPNKTRGSRASKVNAFIADTTARSAHRR